MVKRILICTLFAFFFVAEGHTQEPTPTPTPEATPKPMPKCREFLPGKGECKIEIPIPDTRQNRNPAPTHADVTINPNHKAEVVLTQASPLMNCTIAATPAPLSRDVSSSVTSFLTTVGTLGAPPVLLAQLTPPPKPPPPSSGEAGNAARKIDASLTDLENAANAPKAFFDDVLTDFAGAKTSIDTYWSYTYTDDAAFVAAAGSLFAALQKFEQDKLTTPDDLNKSISSVSDSLTGFHRKYSKENVLNPQECNAEPTCVSAFQDWFNSATNRLFTVRKVSSEADFLIDAQSKMKPAYLWLNAKSRGTGQFTPNTGDPDRTTISLPMSAYAQKQVTETITCKDVATQTQVFDNITFTAYYERAPSWDLSAGALISLVPGRQVGPISGPVSGTPPASPTIFGITSQSAVQFIPAAIFELHPSSLHMNFKCPWAKDGTGDHPWGYVCSLGPAVGILVNPNNGTTAAEFFQGISFGIQRLSFLIGNHTGRFQEFGEGFQLGQTVPSGTTPPTIRTWTNHPAFGITYRIPIR